MAKVNNRDREILNRARRDGGVSVVTHRHREALAEGFAEHRRLRDLCDAGFLRADRVVGDKYDPTGELRSEFKLTAKGEREAR